MLRPRVFSPEWTSKKDSLILQALSFSGCLPCVRRGLLGSAGGTAAHPEAPVQEGGTAIARFMSTGLMKGTGLRERQPAAWMSLCASVLGGSHHG